MSKPDKLDLNDVVVCSCGILFNFEVAKHNQWDTNVIRQQTGCPACKDIYEEED